MSLFRELSAALREGLDELLSASPSRDEVDELTNLLEADLDEAKAELDQAEQDFRRLSARIDTETADAERLKLRAKEAVDAGDDEQGRELIRRRRRVLRGIEILESQATEHTQLCAALQDHIESLEDKLQEIRLRRDFLRTRHRVQSLKDRYERYQREFGLADLTPREVVEEFEDLPESYPDAPVVPEAPLTPRRAGRLADEGDAEPAALRRRDGRAELPPDEDEPALRRRDEDDPEPEVWDRPSRNLRRERDALIRDIERRTAGPEVEADVEAELALLKRRAGREPVDAAEAGPALSPPRPQPSDELPEPAEADVEGPDEPAEND